MKNFKKLIALVAVVTILSAAGMAYSGRSKEILHLEVAF